MTVGERMAEWGLIDDGRPVPIMFAGSATTLAHAETATSLCWFLRWVLDEDERLALAEFRAASVGVRAAPNMDRAPASRLWHRLDLAEREMQRRGR